MKLLWIDYIACLTAMGMALATVLIDSPSPLMYAAASIVFLYAAFVRLMEWAR